MTPQHDHETRRETGPPTASALAEGLMLALGWAIAASATAILSSRKGGLDPVNAAATCLAAACVAAAAYYLIVREERLGRITLGDGHSPTTHEAAYERRQLASTPAGLVVWLLLPEPIRTDFALVALLLAAASLFLLRRARRRPRAAAAAEPSSTPAPTLLPLERMLNYGVGAVCWAGREAFLFTGGGTLVLDGTATASTAPSSDHPFRLVRSGPGFAANCFPNEDVPHLRDADLPDSVIIINNY
jgi:hypothetical protein